MPRIPYPNVPNNPGVPQLLRNAPAGPPAIIGTAAGIAQLVRSFLSQPVWGVFKPVPPDEKVDANGLEVVTVKTGKRKPVVTPDSIVNFGYQQETIITTAPTQDGAFADYNRAASPFEIHLRMTKGGTANDRAKFIKQIEDLDTTQLYDILTPEKTYFNCNITRFELSRENEKGAFWLPNVDLYFREIRSVTSKYINTIIAHPVSASAANVQNNGVQQYFTTSETFPSSVVNK